MLTWTQQADGWHANGYFIQLVAPFRWVLVAEEDASDEAVTVLAEPLATARTLKEAKREAELLAAAAQRADNYRRWGGQLLMALCAVVFTVGLPSPWAVLATAVVAIYGLRCLGLILGSLLSRSNYSYSDFFYQ